MITKSFTPIVGLVITGLLLILAVGALEVQQRRHYVDNGHPNAADDSAHGHRPDRPWQSLKYAFQQLQPGDTLLVAGGLYPGESFELTGANSGRQAAPITIKAASKDKPVIRSPDQGRIRLLAADWWVFEKLVFVNTGFVLGDKDSNIRTSHITFRKVVFRNGPFAAIRGWNVAQLLVEKCRFKNIQQQTAGEDTSAIKLPWYADEVIIRESQFMDISSDGIQLGRVAAHVSQITLENNRFWIKRRPDGSLVNEENQQRWGNTGENGIDVKAVTGPVVIRGNRFEGFRPTIAGQNASGSNGVGLVIHNGAQQVLVEENLFSDNTIHLVISSGKAAPGSTGEITVRNNIFREAQPSTDLSWGGGQAVSIRETGRVALYHNTFYDNQIFLVGRDGAEISFKNNVVVGGRFGGRSTARWAVDYNAYQGLSRQNPAYLTGEHDVQASDLKLDGELRPLADSPVIDAGQGVALATDFEGKSRTDGSPDLGALESAPQSGLLTGIKRIIFGLQF